MYLRNPAAVIIGLLITAYLAILFVTQPLHLEIISDKEPLLTVNGAEHRFASLAELEQRNVEITNLSTNPQSSLIQITPPVDSNGNPLKVLESSGFQFFENLGRYQSGNPGDRIVFQGLSREIKIPFIRSSWSGIAQVAQRHSDSGSENYLQKQLNLNNAKDSWHEEILFPLKSKYYKSVPVSLGGIDFKIDQLPAGVSNAVVKLGLSTLADIPASSSVLNIRLKFIDVLPVLAGQFFSGLKLLLTAVFFIFLFLYTGVLFQSVTCRSNLKESSSTPASLLAIAFCGFFVIADISGFLIYLLPSTTVSYIIWAIFGLSAFNIKGNSKINPLGLFKPLLLSLPAIIAAFWPIFIYGKRFLAMYQTDVFEYGTLATLSKYESLFSLHGTEEASLSGLVTAGAGFSWRAIDSILASVFSQLTFSDFTVGFILTAIIFYWIAACSVYYLGSYLKISPSIRDLATVLVPFAPSLSALYTEGYFSQYYFTCALLIFLAASVPFIDYLKTTLKPELSDPKVQLILLSAAFCLALYPYFFVINGMAITVVMLIELKTGFFKKLLFFAGCFLLLLIYTNFNLMTVLGFTETGSHAKLDEIARNFLLFGFSESQLFDFFTGLRSFHLREDFYSLMIAEFSRLPPLIYRFIQLQLSSVSLVHYAVIVLIGILLGKLLMEIKESSAKVMLSQVIAWSAFFIYYYVNNRSYIYLKSGWALSAWLPFLLLPVFINAARRSKIIFGSALLFLGMVWMQNSLIDKARWLVNLSGKASLITHNGILPTLVEFEQYLDKNRDSISSVQMVKGDENLYGTDRDRTLYVNLRMILRDRNIDCLNCKGIFLPQSISCGLKADALVTVGQSRSILCNKSSKLSLPFSTLY